MHLTHFVLRWTHLRRARCRGCKLAPDFRKSMLTTQTKLRYMHSWSKRLVELRIRGPTTVRSLHRHLCVLDTSWLWRLRRKRRRGNTALGASTRGSTSGPAIESRPLMVQITDFCLCASLLRRADVVRRASKSVGRRPSLQAGGLGKSMSVRQTTLHCAASR